MSESATPAVPWRWVELLVVLVPLVAMTAFMAAIQNWPALALAVAFLSMYVSHKAALRSLAETNATLATLMSANARYADTNATLASTNQTVMQTNRGLIDTLRRTTTHLQQINAHLQNADAQQALELCVDLQAGAVCGDCGQRAAADMVTSSHRRTGGQQLAHDEHARLRHCCSCGTYTPVIGGPR